MEGGYIRIREYIYTYIHIDIAVDIGIEPTETVETSRKSSQGVCLVMRT